jgi:hypothetical protein
MENTIKTAEEYLEWASHSLSNEDGDNPTQAEILYYYAKSLLLEQAVLSFSEGIEWALGRQTRIVLPSYRVTRDIESSAVNRCLDEIKQLNPSATFVTGKK